MAIRRARTPKRSRCPACDEPLDPQLADEACPACPGCGALLLPVEAGAAWRRAVAALIDMGILLVTAGMLNWGLLAMLDLPPLLADARGLDLVLRMLEIDAVALGWRLAPFLVMSAVYLGLFWALTGRTIGEKLLGLRVIDTQGRSPRPVWVAVRVVAHFLSGLPGALGWIWAAFDAEKRAWHDHLARTYVVRNR
jgi:uncharacterized RDD family membrane protein YckC